MTTDELLQEPAWFTGVEDLDQHEAYIASLEERDMVQSAVAVLGVDAHSYAKGAGDMLRQVVAFGVPTDYAIPVADES